MRGKGRGDIVIPTKGKKKNKPSKSAAPTRKALYNLALRRVAWDASIKKVGLKGLERGSPGLNCNSTENRPKK